MILLAEVAEITEHATDTITQSGISMGSALAVVCSWQRNRSILWAILAGILSWIYVIYFAFTRKDEEKK
ncbi:MAG: hypothetical protein AAF491_07825 [Verrucomicrobiota bacterium]